MCELWDVCYEMDTVCQYELHVWPHPRSTISPSVFVWEIYVVWVIKLLRGCLRFDPDAISSIIISLNISGPLWKLKQLDSLTPAFVDLWRICALACIKLSLLLRECNFQLFASHILDHENMLVTQHFHCYFQTFLAQKYGYRPFPPKIDADEFEKIVSGVSKADDKKLLTDWFVRDDNIVPPLYQLTPIREKLPDYANDDNPELKKKVKLHFVTLHNAMNNSLLCTRNLCTIQHFHCNYSFFLNRPLHEIFDRNPFY